MPEETPTPPAGSNAGGSTVETPASGGDNATIRQMRAELDKARAEAAKVAELQTKLTDLERRDMDEKQRLAAELADAQKAAAEAAQLRDQFGKFTTNIQAECDAAIAALPDEKRDAITKLTQHVPLDERMSAIRTAAAALNVGVPQIAGTMTQPVGVHPPTPGVEPPKPLTPQEVARMSWRDALGPVKDTTAALQQQMAEMQQQMAALVAARK